jgi:hypothetical protein
VWLAVAALVVALPGVVVAAVALLHSRSHDARIEQLEGERHKHETRAVLTVTSSPREWSATSSEGPVQVVVAHVRNAGAVPSPPITVRVWVNNSHVGRSKPVVVPGRDVAVCEVKLDAGQHPEPWGHDPIKVHVVDPDGERVLAEWDGRYQAVEPGQRYGAGGASPGGSAPVSR